MKKIGFLIYCFLFFTVCTQAQTAGFTYSQPSRCAPSTVAFTNTSTGSPTGYLWDFGDGFTSPTKDATHPFVNAGTYTVTLTVHYAGGVVDSTKQNISVLSPPVFTFTKLNDSVCPNGSVAFSSSVTSSVPIQSYSWDFGDGGFGATANPTYQYQNLTNQKMNYTVSLTLTDANGCFYKETKSSYIYVKQKPMPDFTADQLYFCYSAGSPSVANFTNNTTVTTNNTYQWLFSDGGNSSSENPTHNFVNPGYFSVNLTATSSEGCSNSISKSNYIEVISFKVLHKVSDTIVCSVPNNVTFQGTNPSNVEYDWDFGDGTTGSSIFFAIPHTYTSSGRYVAKVTGNYRNGLCYDTDSTVIHVYDSITSKMSITDVNMFMCQPFLPVIFENRTPYASTDDFGFGSVVWDFGDSTSASGDSVGHIYPDYGYYLITLSVTTPYGCKLADTTQVIRISPYDVVFGAYRATACVPYDAKLRLFLIYSTTLTSITIDWGDGTTDYNDSLFSSTWDTIKNFNPSTHTYYDTIKYYPIVTAVNEQGCVVTDTLDMIQGGLPPKAWADYTYVEDCYSAFNNNNSPLLVRAFDSLDIHGNPIAGVYANAWIWLEKDSPLELISTREDTIRLGTNNLGYFSVRMIPTHYDCPGDIITLDSIAFVCPPIAGFMPNVSTYCDFPQTIEFNSISVKATSHRWYFGDEAFLYNQSTDTGATASFTYESSKPFVYSNSVIPGLNPIMVAYNDDSVDINSPTYNRCGFCTDTARGSVLISSGTLNFPIPNICENDTIIFSDASILQAEMYGWCFQLYAHDTLNHEHNDRHPPMPLNPTDSLYIAPGVTAPLIFHNKDQYTGIFSNVDMIGCYRSDTIDFFVFPKSVPYFISGKDNISFNGGKDTLCANHPDWLHLRDSSYTLPPFDTADIVAWQWQYITHSSSLQNPSFLDSMTGLFDVGMKITNEYGCTSTTYFREQVLVSEIIPLMAPASEYNCNHTEIEFYNLSYITPTDHNRGAVMIYTWDFGDGSPTYTTQNGSVPVTHTYHLSKLPDTVFVNLTVETAGMDCSATYTNHVIITGPIASFTDDGHIFPCPELGRQIKFSSTSTGNPTKYHWIFGDSISGISNESHLKDPIHDYRNAGSYDIFLAVEDSVGCVDTLSLPQYVFIDGPTGNFTYGELEGCVPHTVVFTPYGMNVDSIIVNPDRASPMSEGGANVHAPLSFTYNTPKAYLPYFYIIKWTDNNGQMERCVVEWEGTDSIYVIDAIPDFLTDTTYCSAAPITFINTSSIIPSNIAIDSVVWDFGNGTTLHNVSDGQIQYSKDGIYTVTLHVYAKSCYQQISKDIEILYFPDILLDMESKSGCDSLECDFQATVAPGNHGKLHYVWTFEDSTKLYANPANKKFDSTGCYHFILEVSLDSNKCTHTLRDSINISVYSSPTADFEAQPQTANFGDEFQFIDKSTSTVGDIVTWKWDLGDNTTDNRQNTSHVYETSGYITVQLQVEDEFGCIDTASLEILILENLSFPNILTLFGLNGERHVFRPMEEKGYYKEFRLDIYNRWGNHIWTNQCRAPGCPDYSDAFWWDGVNKQGNIVEDGVYYWVVTALPLSETKVFIQNGSVTVINTK